MSALLTCRPLPLLVLVFTLVTVISSLPVPTSQHITYLREFGYLSESTSSLDNVVYDDVTISNAIQRFQLMAAITQTGKMNEETEAKMKVMRCGISDATPTTSLQKRVRRYYLVGTIWKNMNLTYKIFKYSRHISQTVVDKSAVESFKFWSDVTPFTFTQVYGDADADIMMEFITREHDDEYPFDGPGGVLGHAFQPESGRVHLDDDENWTVRRYGGVNLVQVMTHEFGHILGLKHSPEQHTVMHPFYNGYNRRYRLEADDIHGIQHMYGGPNGNPPPSTPTTVTASRTTSKTTPETTPITTPMLIPSTTSSQETRLSICDSPSFDAVTMNQGDVFAFKGENFYILSSKQERKPRSINTFFKGVPSNIDAVLNIGKKLIFIKDHKVYVVLYNDLLNGYPRPIHALFPGAPSKVDAAFTFDHRVYLVSGGRYYKTVRQWMFLGRRPMPVMRSRSPFSNAPKRMDALLQWPGRGSFAFTGTTYRVKYEHSQYFTEARSIYTTLLKCA